MPPVVATTVRTSRREPRRRFPRARRDRRGAAGGGGSVAGPARPFNSAASRATSCRSTNFAGGAEISLLVEDDWQRQGIGTALLARLAALAEAQGITELSADCLAGDDVLPRTAARAGLRTERGAEDGAKLRLFLPA
jgi:GNAT superfamily N-acetyltransferase